MSSIDYSQFSRFSATEFREFADAMAQEQLEMLEKFTIAYGRVVIVSPAQGSLGRRAGPEEMSGHNIDKWGKVFATDLFPQKLAGADFSRVLKMALQAGATGIGFYADTFYGGRAAPMLHLDTRPDRTPQNPRLWVRIRGKYGPIESVMPAMWSRSKAIADAFPAPVVAPAIAKKTTAIAKKKKG